MRLNGAKNMINVFQNLEKTVIIDGDSLCYIALYNAEKDTLPRDFFVNSAEYQKDKNNLAKLYIKKHIENILDATGCKDLEVYLTEGRDSFRYKIDKEYKVKRKNVAPLEGLGEIKLWVSTEYKGEICRSYEADDMVVWRGKSPDTIIAAIDKDVLLQSEGDHYNYKKNEWITVTKEEASRYLWTQMIVGDATDGVYGIEGMGPKKAETFLNSFEASLYYNEVLKLYVEKDKSRKDFFLNLNLLDMHLLNDKKEIKLHMENQTHYSQLGIEPIEIMKLNLSEEQYIGFLKGNIIKYSHRKKGQDLEDAQKIQVYAKWLEEALTPNFKKA